MATQLKALKAWIYSAFTKTDQNNLCLRYSGSSEQQVPRWEEPGGLGLVCVWRGWSGRQGWASLTGTVWFSVSLIRGTLPLPGMGLPGHPYQGIPTILSLWWEPPVEVRPWDGVKVMGSTSSCQRSESYIFMAATAMKQCHENCLWSCFMFEDHNCSSS